MRNALFLAIGLILLAGAAPAQDAEQSWDNLQALRAGERVQVVDQTLRSREGAFVRASADAIIVRVGQNEETIPRVDVLRVTSRERSKRGRNVLIGLAIGAGVGAGVGLGVLAATGGSDFPGEVLGPSVGVGAAAGAGLGAALPGHATLYRVERRRP
jgi:hypothetical protein